MFSIAARFDKYWAETPGNILLLESVREHIAAIRVQTMVSEELIMVSEGLILEVSGILEVSVRAVLIMGFRLRGIWRIAIMAIFRRPGGRPGGWSAETTMVSSSEILDSDKLRLNLLPIENVINCLAHIARLSGEVCFWGSTDRDPRQK
jgi:hypothetical protein